ncbi:hypothetical protein GCM10023083_41060 [Streptomyces phyllanthi]
MAVEMCLVGEAERVRDTGDGLAPAQSTPRLGQPGRQVPGLGRVPVARVKRPDQMLPGHPGLVGQLGRPQRAGQIGAEPGEHRVDPGVSGFRST